MSFSWQQNSGEYDHWKGGIGKPEPLSEQNRRILILEAIGEFDEELCHAVKQKVEQRLEQLSRK